MNWLERLRRSTRRLRFAIALRLLSDTSSPFKSNTPPPGENDSLPSSSTSSADDEDYEDCEPEHPIYVERDDGSFTPVIAADELDNDDRGWSCSHVCCSVCAEEWIVIHLTETPIWRIPCHECGSTATILAEA